MGMYSNFKIELVDFEGDLEEIGNKLNEISEYSCDVDCGYIEVYDCKWYGYFEDMCSLSEEYPKIKFRVFRDYEEGVWMVDGVLKTGHEYCEFHNGEGIKREIIINLGGTK